MAIALRASGAKVESATSGGTPTTFTVPSPSGVQAGDYVIIVFRSQTSAGGATEPTCPGFTRISQNYADSGLNIGSARLNAFLARFSNGSEPGSYALTVNTSGGARWVAQAFAFSGVHPDTPVAAKTNISATGNPVPAFADAAGKFVLEMWASEFVANADHALGTYNGPLSLLTELVSPASRSLTVSRTAMRTHSGYVGSSGNPSHTNVPVGSPSSPTVLQVALNDAPPAIPQGLEVDYVKSGQAAKKARLTAVVAGVERVVTAVGYVPRGYASVMQMLDADEFMMAHRGGSADWPEMTRRAYTNAVAWGAGMLEFSSFRTSDGVWVGSHDATTERMFPDHPVVDIRNVTWADLQPYRTRNGGHPFYRLDQFLDEYAKTHICMVDNKAASFRPEYLDLLDAHGGPRRIMNKSWSGSAGNRDVARLAGLRGYKSWGFIYASEIANLPTWKQYWDAMGLEYSASQAEWDTLIAGGPSIVIAHIMPTAAAVQTAKDKIVQAMANTGRTVRYGYQISGVKSAIPRRLAASVSLL